MELIRKGKYNGEYIKTDIMAVWEIADREVDLK